MTVTVDFEDELVKGRDTKAFRAFVREGVHLREYIDSEISLGEFAERMGMGYVEARDWLHKKGIPTLRKLPPESQAWVDKSYQEALKDLGLK